MSEELVRKVNYREMYARWQEYSDTGFYTGKTSV